MLKVADAAFEPGGGARLSLGLRVPTKTGEARMAYVSPELASLLDLERDPGAWLFPSKRWPETKPQSRGSLRNVVARWLAEVGLTGVRDLHSFRRRGAVKLHAGGVPTEAAKRVTGHESSAQFLGYAERGVYRLADERRLLWLNPLEKRGAS